MVDVELRPVKIFPIAFEFDMANLLKVVYDDSRDTPPRDRQYDVVPKCQNEHILVGVIPY
ncbi:MAG TPA: hypothetical protein VGZ00_09355 [Candidatus Baltobacteraceae bacterium]|nr:hypothetical protein [Candidatus Baltobacteraceae bacterium]